ncbi:MAG: site-2 protease family protein [SAR324 cluster bacterium]|jgi:Zn-dependent protease|nr:site-2 protease family protein [SAR324 cluster bacterium]
MLLSLPPQVLIILAFCLIFALTFHEFGHAYTAHLCGDDTAKAAGRMSLNPLVHLDLFGSLMVLIVGLGYARPVPVNPNNYRVRNADFYIASAGPLMNLLLGIIGAFLYGILAQNSITTLAGVPLLFLLKLFIIINFNLFLFNLIPLGPLDGNSVFPHFLPPNLRIRYQHWNFRYGSYALIGLVLLSILLPNFNAFSWITSISMSMTNGLL